MSEFSDTLKVNLDNLTSELIDKDKYTRKMNKNLDSLYQDELNREQKRKMNNILKRKKKEQEERKEYNFFDLSLKNVYINFINTFSNIFTDLLLLSKKEISKSNEESQIYNVIFLYIQEIFYIFFQVSRLIYVGIAFIIASFFVFFILSTK